MPLPCSSPGSRLRGNNFMIDGQDSNDPSISGRQQQINNPDIVQEVRLITNQFNAEYGRSAGSVVNVITRNGTNDLHGSLFWFHNDNHLNTGSNLEKRLFTDSPFRIENQFGGTVGGPIWRDHTFFFGSLQRWTDRQLQAGVTLSGAPSDAGRQVLRSVFPAGVKPQVDALLRFVPAGVPNGQTKSFTAGGNTYIVPLSDLTSALVGKFNDWQWSSRIDHRWRKQSLGGRYLYNDQLSVGRNDQATPPGLGVLQPSRSNAVAVFLTSEISPRLFNEGRIAYQRFSSISDPADPATASIPSTEITDLSMKGFNAGASRTAFGLGVNIPQFRYNNTYQLQDNMTWNRASHTLKWGIDFRKVEAKSFFIPTTRGLLRYKDLQNFVDDLAEAANINIPLPGGSKLVYYKWYDYFGFFQDTWQVKPSFTLNYGLRYESPGNAVASLYPLSDQITAANGNLDVFRLTPRPDRSTKNFQPRFGFNWNPHKDGGFLGHITGGNRLVVRGGYSRTNDYTFINIALNVASAFPFIYAISSSNRPNAFGSLPTLPPPSLAQLPTLTRTVVASDFRPPIAEQFALELQREVATNTVVKVGWIATKGTALFQSLDGNPRIRCALAPTFDPMTGNINGTVPCPRVDPSREVIRLRANAANSIYHSL